MSKSWRFYQKLNQKKYRRESRLFLVEGSRLCMEALNSNWEIEAVFFCESFQQKPISEKFQKQLNEKNIKPQVISDSNLKKLANTKTPQGIVIVLKIPELNEKTQLSSKTNTFNVLLEGIRDPGNLGTIIRTADWFGVNQIILAEDTADPFNPKVVRSSMGSIFHVPLIEVNNIKAIMEKLKNNGHLIVGTSPSSKNNLKDLNITTPISLILGGEAQGLTEFSKNLADVLVQIPKYGDGESLNVSVAAGILFHHIAQKIRN